MEGHDRYAFTAPVGSFSPNAFGLYDVHDNVWECLHFKIKGLAVMISSAELAGVPTRSFGEKVISTKNRRDEIIAALDLLFTGI